MYVLAVNVFLKMPHFVTRYRSFLEECHQVMRIRSAKAKTFKDAAEAVGEQICDAFFKIPEPLT